MVVAMGRLLVGVVAVAVLAVACSGGPTGEVGEAGGALGAGPSTTAAPQAPDFTLTLSDGSSFVLSEESRPVYLIFWAEW